MADAGEGTPESIMSGLGLGGSGTNDADLGMLEALGLRFYDEDKKLDGKYGIDIGRVRSIDISSADIRLRDCRFHLASDVNNPLIGDTGATVVFGPQKGAPPEIVAVLDSADVFSAERSMLGVSVNSPAIKKFPYPPAPHKNASFFSGGDARTVSPSPSPCISSCPGHFIYPERRERLVLLFSADKISLDTI